MTFLCFLQEREEVRMRLSWNEGVKKGNRRDEAKKSQECCWGGEALADWLTPSTAKLSAPGGGWAVRTQQEVAVHIPAG